MMPALVSADITRRCRRRVWLCTGLFLIGLAPAWAAPPLDPLPAPSYTFDRASPSVQQGYFSACDVLGLAYPHPVVILPAAMLGLLPCCDELDTLSAGHGNFLPSDTFALLFSVDRQTVGTAFPDPELVALGVPYNALDQGARRQAAGDQFSSTELFTLAGNTGTPVHGARYNNFQVRNNFDEGGVDVSAYPATHAHTIVEDGVPQDHLATAALLDMSEGGAITRLYFSLSADSPSLATLPGDPSGANLYSAGSLATGSACCLANGCEILSEDACLLAGGLWLGPAATCDQCRPLLRATAPCCLNDGSCRPLSQAACDEIGGSWLGPAATCDACPTIGTGACCFSESGCQLLEFEACDAASGSWLGAGTICMQCAPIGDGACCLPDGSCQAVDNEAACTDLGGLFQGNVVCLGDSNSDGTDDLCEWPMPRMPITLFASFADLSLVAEDDIDAAVVFDFDQNGYFAGADVVVFSLTAGSPSLATISGASGVGAAGDVFVVTPGQAPYVFAAATDLGLGASSDNLVALDVYRTSGLRMDALHHGIRALRGDMNCDGTVNWADVDAFVLALCSPARYRATYPDCDARGGDCNSDGKADFGDINPFVALLLGDK